MLIECIPVLSGLLLALLYQYSKPTMPRNALIISLLFFSSLLANWLSGEGLQFLYVDVLLNCASMLGFLFAGKLYARIRRM